MYSEAGGNGCRAAPATLITLYNIFDGSFCFSDSHKSNSRYNPDPGTPVFCVCGFSHKSAAAPIWLQKQNPVWALPGYWILFLSVSPILSTFWAKHLLPLNSGFSPTAAVFSVSC